MKLATTVRRRRRAAPALALFLLLPALAGAQGYGRAQDEVLKVEVQRFAAMVHAEVAALDGFLADELTYVHSTGLRQTKKELIDDIRTGKIKYRSIESSGVEARTYGDAVVVTGTARLKVLIDGQERTPTVVYTEVYVRRGDRWQLVSWESTNAPPPKAGS
jgi:uncharacterized protein DUF4440